MEPETGFRVSSRAVFFGREAAPRSATQRGEENGEMSNLARELEHIGLTSGTLRIRGSPSRRATPWGTSPWKTAIGPEVGSVGRTTGLEVMTTPIAMVWELQRHAGLL